MPNLFSPVILAVKLKSCKVKKNLLEIRICFDWRLLDAKLAGFLVRNIPFFDTTQS